MTQWQDPEAHDHEWRTAPEVVQRAAVQSLVGRGCPPDLAGELAAQVPYSSVSGWVCLELGGTQSCDPVEDGEDAVDVAAESVWGLASNLADDNAEANDRSARGEPGWRPLWSLADRPSRRG